LDEQRHLSRPAELEAALQRSHGTGEVALIELEGAEAEEGVEKRVDLPRLLRDVHRFAGTPERLGEPPERHERDDQHGPHDRAFGGG